jgi:hypothetical protein
MVVVYVCLLTTVVTLLCMYGRQPAALHRTSYSLMRLPLCQKEHPVFRFEATSVHSILISKLVGSTKPHSSGRKSGA